MVVTDVKHSLSQLDSGGALPPVSDPLLERLNREVVEGVVDCKRTGNWVSGLHVRRPAPCVLRKDGDLRVLTPWSRGRRLWA